MARSFGVDTGVTPELIATLKTIVGDRLLRPEYSEVRITWCQIEEAYRTALEAGIIPPENPPPSINSTPSAIVDFSSGDEGPADELEGSGDGNGDGDGDGAGPVYVTRSRSTQLRASPQVSKAAGKRKAESSKGRQDRSLQKRFIETEHELFDDKVRLLHGRCSCYFLAPSLQCERCLKNNFSCFGRKSEPSDHRCVCCKVDRQSCKRLKKEKASPLPPPPIRV
jgi:hypothetical protein